MTHADGHFAIGKTHAVCQDYVRFGTAGGFAYVIVSDGCSGSMDTDIGSRLMALAAERYIHKFASVAEASGVIDFEVIAHMALTNAQQLGLDPTCLDATLLIALETADAIAVYVMGDGVVCARNRDGSYYNIRYNFFLGAPYYPSYLTDENRLDTYFSYKKNQVVEIKGVVGGTEEDRAMNTEDYRWNWPVAILDKSEYDVVALMSDGAMSFRKGLDTVAPVEIVKQILDVKVSTGEFMARRAKRFLSNYCSSQGWHHDDDFSVGAIFIDQPKVAE